MVTSARGILFLVIAGLGASVSLADPSPITHRIPISGLSVVVAIVVSSLVGTIFGTAPATAEAKLDPVESTCHE